MIAERPLNRPRKIISSHAIAPMHFSRVLPSGFFVRVCAARSSVFHAYDDALASAFPQILITRRVHWHPFSSSSSLARFPPRGGRVDRRELDDEGEYRCTRKTTAFISLGGTPFAARLAKLLSERRNERATRAVRQPSEINVPIKERGEQKTHSHRTFAPRPISR